jgi:hypothetical protein
VPARPSAPSLYLSHRHSFDRAQLLTGCLGASLSRLEARTNFGPVVSMSLGCDEHPVRRLHLP